MRHYCILVGATIILSALALLGIKVGFGWKSLVTRKKNGPLIRDPVVWTKFTTIVSLQTIGKHRPYTEQEMALLRKAISDPEESIRAMAIAALREVKHDPKQREEAIRLIIPCLKDPEWLVRAYAVRSMAWLEVKEAIPKILPLLKDPKPEVREAAKWTLQKLGYQIRE